MSFSKRMGLTPATKSLQIDSMDNELRNGLWDITFIYFVDKITDNYFFEPDLNSLCLTLWHKFFKETIDSIPEHISSIKSYIREKFFTGDWNYVYEMVEFFSQVDFRSFDTERYISGVNIILGREFSAYRFVNGIIAPITNSTEIIEIEEAIGQPEYFTHLNGVNTHLNAALKMLSDRKDPDFRNSVKESISAVETTCRILTSTNTLGKALSSLEANGITISNQLKEGFNKIYAYTNNPDTGIRHSMIEGNYIPDFADAKFMLVSCSAFVNYLISKSNLKQ